jgi:hypothetical protein
MYIVKNQSGTFENGEQPDNFKVTGSLENRFFICECSTTPVSEFVVEFPKEQCDKHIFYQHPNGRKLWYDPFNGAVQFGVEVDSKNRRAIIYNEQQLLTQLSYMKWLALNVWIPDKVRMYTISEDIVQSHLNQIDAIDDADLMRVYIRKNLYYNL